MSFDDEQAEAEKVVRLRLKARGYGYREFCDEMDDLGLYKVHREEDDDHAFARVLAQLRAFAEHCHRVVARDLDLIITLY